MDNATLKQIVEELEGSEEMPAFEDVFDGNVRKAITRFLEVGFERTRESLIAARNVAVQMRNFYQQQYDNGLDFYVKGILSKAELERRRANLQNIENEVNSFDYKLEAAEQSLSSLKESLG